MLRFKIHSRVNFRSKESKNKLNHAILTLSLTLNSDEFRNRIIYNPMLNNEFESNYQIYTRLQEGKEVGTPVDYEADLRLVLMYSESDNAIGYTNNGIIYIYKNKFDAYQIHELAGFYAHEYCHLIGYQHAIPLTNMENDICYQVGNLVSDIALRAAPVFA